MSRLKLYQKEKLYIRLLLGVTLCIIATLIAASSVYYFSYSRILQKQVFDSNLSNLNQTSREVVSMTESSQALSFQIYRHSAISKLLFYSNPSPFDVQGAMIDLKNYLASMPFIESIYVYNPTAGFYVVSNRGVTGIFSEEEMEDQDIVNLLGRFEDYKSFTPVPRTYKIQQTDDEPTGIYTYLCYDAIGFNRQINSAVIVNLSASWINKEIARNSDGNDDRTFIIEDNGNIIAGDDLALQEWDKKDLELIESTVRQQGPGYIVTNFAGIKSLISYTAPDKLSWQYLRITPYGNITAQIDAVRMMTIQVAAIILLVGILISWLLSKFLYVPIHQIVRRVDNLESEKRDSSYTIRQNALRKLIQLQAFNPGTQLEHLRRLGIIFDFTKQFRLIYIRMDHFSSLKEQKGNDLSTYKFAIMNISSEIISKYNQVEAIDLDEDSLLLMINILDHTNELSQPVTLIPILEQIQQACMEYLHIEVTIVASPVSSQQPHILFKQVKEASFHRFFRGLGSIINMECEKIWTQQAYDYSFPTTKEKRLTDALVAGKTKEAKNIYWDIMQETSAYPIQVAESVASLLAMSISSTVAEIQKNGSMYFSWEDEWQIPKFENFETLEQLSEAYNHFFDELIFKIGEKRSGKQELLTRKIEALIDERYADHNLGLNLIADEFGMSSSHLSRVYRQQTLTTIVDVINQVRMKHAQRLLQETDFPVTEIAERTGYTNSSYFHRMFKKMFGVTPAEYRKSNH